MKAGSRGRTLALAAGTAGLVALAASLLLLAETPAPEARRTEGDRAPVGLVASPLVVAVDRRGNVMPVDPADPVLDLPVLSVQTPTAESLWGLRILAHDVGHMAEMAPEVFAVISEARVGDREIALLLGDSGIRIRYVPPITEARLREGIVALNDAVERLGEDKPREIDLRFEDQVVVRTR